MSELKPVVGLDDVFGVRAKKMRVLQSQLFQLFDENGYQEVIPPLFERPESLQAGAGRFLSDQTLVFPDPAGAGLLAMRPDITPQIARIVATRLQQQEQWKLCYSGPVVQARPDENTGSRQQWQMGVEVFGMSAKEGDFEVIQLAARCMQAAGFTDALLQIGHVGLLRALVDTSLVEDVADLLARRSPDDFQAFCCAHHISGAAQILLSDMIAGVADEVWLAKNQHASNAAFATAAQELLSLSGALQQQFGGNVHIQVDAALMPRFFYHSGMIFSGFAASSAEVLLHGGRYDDMMSAHGRDMPATGFSFDLWRWIDAQ